VRLTDLDFDAWLDFMFGRPARSEFYPFFDEREEVWDPAPAVAVDYLTRLYETPAPLLHDYSDRQIGGGLWLLASEESHALYSREVPVEARERCVAALYRLYADLFDPRCAPALGHLDEPGAGALNAACYMWWDILPFVAATDDPDKDRLDARAIDVLEKVLRLANPACQESALHGLGHLVRHVRQPLDPIFAAYLERRDIRPELATYARAARSGCIL